LASIFTVGLSDPEIQLQWIGGHELPDLAAEDALPFSLIFLFLILDIASKT